MVKGFTVDHYLLLNVTSIQSSSSSSTRLNHFYLRLVFFFFFLPSSSLLWAIKSFHMSFDASREQLSKISQSKLGPNYGPSTVQSISLFVGPATCLRKIFYLFLFGSHIMLGKCIVRGLVWLKSEVVQVKEVF